MKTKLETATNPIESASLGDSVTVSAQTAHPDRAEMIAVAAYYRAEQRGFAPGDELGDWLQAESTCNMESAPQLPFNS